jgi:hypothetical protein
MVEDSGESDSSAAGPSDRTWLLLKRTLSGQTWSISVAAGTTKEEADEMLALAVGLDSRLRELYGTEPQRTSRR